MKNWGAELCRQHAGFISELGLPLVDLLRPQAGERILETKLEPVLRGENGIWRADYARLRVLAAKPYS